jgi:multidrug efflux pump subunit AcrA (membrane-fusion protein)
MASPSFYLTSTIIGLDAYSTYQDAKFQEDLLEYNAAVTRNNAIANANVLETQAAIAAANAKAEDANIKANLQNAEAARDQARLDADRIQQRADRLRGSQRAIFAKSGVTLEGTPSDVILDSAIQFEQERLLAIYKGNVTAHGFRQDANNAKIRKAGFNNRSTLLGYQSALVLNQGEQQANLFEFRADNIRRSVPLRIASNTINRFSSSVTSGLSFF